MLLSQLLHNSVYLIESLHKVAGCSFLPGYAPGILRTFRRSPFSWLATGRLVIYFLEAPKEEITLFVLSVHFCQIIIRIYPLLLSLQTMARFNVAKLSNTTWKCI